MPAKPWKDWTDDELADAAQQGMTGQGAQVEAMRRLKESIVTFSGSSDRYSRRMLWLTIVLLILTLVQAIAVVPNIKGWFAAQASTLDLLALVPDRAMEAWYHSALHE